MLKAARTAIVLAALTSLPSSARAICGGSTFATCASVSVSAWTAGNGNTVVQMTITNLAGQSGTYAGAILSTAGLWGLGNFTYVSGTLQKTSGTGTWQLGTSGLSGAGISAQVVGTNNSGGLSNGLHANESVTLQFEITGLTDLQILAAANNWAVHEQGGYNNCSTKLVVTSGVPNDGPYDPNCIDPGGTTTSVAPEPASLALLGTGLFGLAGVVRRRRNA